MFMTYTEMLSFIFNSVPRVTDKQFEILENSNTEKFDAS